MSALLAAMKDAGANRFYAKRLARNDNSKNQVYLGPGFEALNIIPHGNIETDATERAGSNGEREKAPVSFYWIDAGGVYEAPNTKLILYPDYPEIRMSGFLLGARNSPNALMTSRDPGRVLFLGICPDGRVLGYAVGAHSDLATELDATEPHSTEGVFLSITRLALASHVEPLDVLLMHLRTIHGKGWINGQRMRSDGTSRPYIAPNGGGYTLEAELGIIPNGRAEPDFLGWEIKQYSVNNLVDNKAKLPVTLMTPEPTFGLYAHSFSDFMMRHGYKDKLGREERRNFGGTYRAHGPFHKDTNIRLTIVGYNDTKNIIDDIDGYIALTDQAGEIAAGWSFKNILNHWNRKHAQAVYVPSITQRALPSYQMRRPPTSYHYGNKIEIARGTDFFKFLQILHKGSIYIDPGVKQLPTFSKKRNPFRVKHSDLADLYHHFSVVDITA